MNHDGDRNRYQSTTLGKTSRKTRISIEIKTIIFAIKTNSVFYQGYPLSDKKLYEHNTTINQNLVSDLKSRN